MNSLWYVVVWECLLQVFGSYMQFIRDRYMKETEERSGRAMMEKAAEAAMLEEALSKC